MEIVCTKPPVAYVEDPGGDAHALFNLGEHVELRERTTPGGDGAPIIVDGGCGRTFEHDVHDPAHVAWDFNTIDRGEGVIDVVERHLAIPCPYCGSTADHLSEPVQTQTLESYLDDQRDEYLTAILGSDYDPSIPERVKLALERGVRGGADAGYSNFTEGAVALVAATAKSIIGVNAPSGFGMSLTHVEVSFDGVTASAIPVLIEVLASTFATNGPGTNSTSTTVRQEYGRSVTAGSTSAKGWTTEPTVLTAQSMENLLTPNGGDVIYDIPLGKEPDFAVSTGFVVRCTAPAAVNVRSTAKWRRC